jgi:chromate reductase
MKIIAFAGSNSKNSINRQLIEKTASFFKDEEVEILDLRNFDAPIYSDVIEEEGIPASILALRKKLSNADAFILSTPENNGFTTAFFKNILDWLSRLDRKTFGDKPVLFMSASPGGRAGQSVRENLSKLMPRWGADILVNYGMGNFNQKVEDGVWTKEAEMELLEQVEHFKSALRKIELA